GLARRERKRESGRFACGVPGLCAAALPAHGARADHGARLRRLLPCARAGGGAAQPDARPAHGGGRLRRHFLALRRDVKALSRRAALRPKASLIAAPRSRPPRPPTPKYALPPCPHPPHTL